MSKIQQEIQIALFGQSASGKTTLLASYFGNQQRNSFEKEHGYRLAAKDTSMGNKLLSRYYKMEEEGEFPLGTVTFEEYHFNFMVHNIAEPSFKIVWHDYPGGWWENSPKDKNEEQVRREAFKNLLKSHVGILLIDGEKYHRHGKSYVNPLFDQFKNEIRNIKDSLASDGNPIADFPKQWIIAISKADILPESMTAEDICKKIVMSSSDQLAGLAEAVDSKDFGCQYMLISSAIGKDKKVINAHQYIGIQLIAPVALLSVLDEIAKTMGTERGYGIFKGIFEKLRGLVSFIDKIDDILPQKYQVVTLLIKYLHLQEGLEKGVEYFRQKQAIAAQKGDTIGAAVAAMKAELASDAAQRAFYRNQW